MKHFKFITLFFGALLLLLVTTSFNVHKLSPDFVIESALGMDVKIYVKKSTNENFTSEDVPPKLRLCQWPSDFTPPSFDQSDSGGRFLTLEDFDALSHPTLIHLEHSDFVAMQSGDYHIKKVGCSSDSNDVYVIPQFYFDPSIFGCNREPSSLIQQARHGRWCMRGGLPVIVYSGSIHAPLPMRKESLA